MLKHFKDNAAVLVFSAGLFTATLAVGFAFIYGLEHII